MKTINNSIGMNEEGQPFNTWSAVDLLDELTNDSLNGNLDDVRSLFADCKNQNARLDVIKMHIDRLEIADNEGAKLLRILVTSLIYNS